MSASPLTPVASRPCYLEAVGDENQLLVFRSPVVRDDDDWYRPVAEYIRDHGFELADQDTFEATGMMVGEVQASWYMSPTALRDGMLSSGGPRPLLAMWQDLS